MATNNKTVIEYDDEAIRRAYEEETGFPLTTGSAFSDAVISGVISTLLTNSTTGGIAIGAFFGLMQDAANSRKNLFKRALVELGKGYDVTLVCTIEPNTNSNYPAAYVEWKLFYH
ncbi:hypothetical protein BX659_1274 [Orenia metallireducens]|uniref:Uncharacterized protein n=1 Tax=Orenia metallireducens TaxID=1413210 RepID=A0A285I320_9FIRM|nr:hypothetical protein [Orenia metallireducens]PRX23112.1 hypothetical protein BX659_1274 [Orenia metallireducens]SNY42348.1 hypothetical protein SAMN06265827_1304 [Orenia metallireducens]